MPRSVLRVTRLGDGEEGPPYTAFSGWLENSRLGAAVVGAPNAFSAWAGLEKPRCCVLGLAAASARPARTDKSQEEGDNRKNCCPLRWCRDGPLQAGATTALQVGKIACSKTLFARTIVLQEPPQRSRFSLPEPAPNPAPNPRKEGEAPLWTVNVPLDCHCSLLLPPCRMTRWR